MLQINYNLELTSFLVMQLTFLEVWLGDSQVSSLVTECGKKKSLRQSVGACLASTVMAHSITSYLRKQILWKYKSWRIEINLTDLFHFVEAMLV